MVVEIVKSYWVVFLTAPLWALCICTWAAVKSRPANGLGTLRIRYLSLSILTAIPYAAFPMLGNNEELIFIIILLAHAQALTAVIVIYCSLVAGRGDKF